MSTFGVGGEDRQDLTKRENTQVRQRSTMLLRELIRPHRARFGITVLFVLVSTALQVAGPALIARGFDTGFPAAVEDRDFLPIILITAGFLLSGLGASVFLALYTRWSIAISQDVLAELRRRIFAHTQRLSLEFHERYTSGRIIARQTSDVDTLGELLNGGLSSLVSGILFLLFTAIALVWIDPLSGIPLVVAMVPVALITWWFSAASRREFRASRIYSTRLIIQFVETMTGIRAVKSFRREPVNNETYAEKVEDYREATRRTIQVFGIYEPTLKVIGSLTVATVLLLGAFRVIEGGLAVGALLAVVLYTRRFFGPIEGLAMFYNSFQSASAALEKISGFLEEQPSVAEPRNPEPFVATRGDIELRDVSFAYTPDAVVLPEFSLTIHAGETVALVGATGAGKSTLAKIIARFYDPTSGTVTLDGRDLRGIADADVRRAVTLVTQEAYLFSGSVADNIRMGKPDATEDDIIRAAQAVGAHDFIAALPEGYDTDVNKRGNKLSAGQRQLVSFCRAFIADPRVLILDEATASLDMPSERLIQRGLSTLLAGRTAIIIAHRLSTVATANRVLVMDSGRIVEDGPTAELLAGTGRFATLHRAWRDSLV
ncbi:ATP-binding cassette subfamily B protein [Microbacteriaceae bacterium MWH-Ta3]|nr:ATP-binding cassette subfamily B protein [Microbacteriaceae bacterium MWH-Ta3]